jgi:hypothetical protein
MGTQNTVSNVTQTTSTIAPYLAPYATDIAGQAQGLYNYNLAHPPIYGDERIQGFTPEQQQAQAGIGALAQPGQFATGANAVSQGMNYDPSQFTAQQLNTPNLQQYQMAPAQTFGNEQAQQYMSPYVQNVVDVQKREALLDAQKAQLAGNLGAARTGTYGGARQLLATTERERNLGTQMGDIQAKGLQSAYENAQSQFERDRAAQMGVGKENLAAQLGTQELGTKTGLEALLANQRADQEAQRMAEQSRQFGSSQMLTGGIDLANMGNMQQQGDIARLAAQEAAGGRRQALEQAGLDQRYADFMRQYEEPSRQLSLYMANIHGLPAANSSTSTSSAPAPSLGAQAIGLGLQGLGAYNMYNSGAKAA